MINKLILILIGIICILFYTLFVQENPLKDPNASQLKNQIQKTVSLRENKSTPMTTMALNETKREKNIASSEALSKNKPQSKTENKPPKIELKYYNLSIEKDYNRYYKSGNQTFLEQKTPPLNTTKNEEKSSLDFHLSPEFNYNKQTKELSIDGVQIQLEKKF